MVVNKQALHSFNMNKKIWKMYFEKLLPKLVTDRNDGNYTLTAICDLNCLQSLSKRVHYGKFVAEAKFRESREEYETAIKAKDEYRLMDLLTNQLVEKKVKRRVNMKVENFGKDVNVEDGGGVNKEPSFKIVPGLVVELYEEQIIPWTKEVEIEYLLRRLD